MNESTFELYHKQFVDGVYRLDAGTLPDDCFQCLQAIGVVALLGQACSTAIQREMLPFIRYVLVEGLKALFGIEGINALPS